MLPASLVFGSGALASGLVLGFVSGGASNEDIPKSIHTESLSDTSFAEAGNSEENERDTIKRVRRPTDLQPLFDGEHDELMLRIMRMVLDGGDRDEVFRDLGRMSSVNSSLRGLARSMDEYNERRIMVYLIQVLHDPDKNWNCPLVRDTIDSVAGVHSANTLWVSAAVGRCLCEASNLEGPDRERKLLDAARMIAKVVRGDVPFFHPSEWGIHPQTIQTVPGMPVRVQSDEDSTQYVSGVVDVDLYPLLGPYSMPRRSYICVRVNGEPTNVQVLYGDDRGRVYYDKNAGFKTSFDPPPPVDNSVDITQSEYEQISAYLLSSPIQAWLQTKQNLYRVKDPYPDEYKVWISVRCAKFLTEARDSGRPPEDSEHFGHAVQEVAKILKGVYPLDDSDPSGRGTAPLAGMRVEYLGRVGTVLPKPPRRPLSRYLGYEVIFDDGEKYHFYNNQKGKVHYVGAFATSFAVPIIDQDEGDDDY